MMEEFKKDLGDDYVPFINMIDFGINEQTPLPRPEHQQQTILPPKSVRATADILVDVLPRKQQRQQQLLHRSSSSHREGDEGEGGEGTSRRRVRTPSLTAAAAEQSFLPTTRRRHRPRASIIVTTLFSILYFVSLFTSKLDILLPSYFKSASESVHQLYRTSEAQSYLDYLEELAHPTIYLVQYIMSRAASDIGDMGGVVGGHQPPSPPSSVHPSPTSPPQPLGPLDILKRQDLVRRLPTSHHHQWTSRTSTAGLMSRYLSQTSRLTTSSSGTSGHVLYIRMTQSWPYIVLTENEYNHLYEHDVIKLTNVDIALQAGYRNLYQHIHLHQQATDAINFKIMLTSKHK